jgi:hypothetical protein
MGRVFKSSEERYYSICKQLFTPSPSIIELPYNITKVAKEKVTYVDEPFTLPKALIDRLQVTSCFRSAYVYLFEVFS